MLTDLMVSQNQTFNGFNYFLWIQHSRYALNILNAFEINKESLPYSYLKECVSNSLYGPE